MNIYVRLFLWAMVTMATSCQGFGCSLEERISQKLANGNPIARDFIIDFLVLCTLDPGNFYEQPIDDTSILSEIEVEETPVKTEKYQMLIFWQSKTFLRTDRDTQLCWWIFIPLSLQVTLEGFKRRIVAEARKLKTTENHPINSPYSRFYQLKQRAQQSLSTLLKDWMIKDRFNQSIETGDLTEEIEMISLYNPVIQKAIFVGTSPNKPRWIL